MTSGYNEHPTNGLGPKAQGCLQYLMVANKNANAIALALKGGLSVECAVSGHVLEDFEANAPVVTCVKPDECRTLRWHFVNQRHMKAT